MQAYEGLAVAAAEAARKSASGKVLRRLKDWPRSLELSNASTGIRDFCWLGPPTARRVHGLAYSGPQSSTWFETQGVIGVRNKEQPAPPCLPLAN